MAASSRSLLLCMLALWLQLTETLNETETLLMLLVTSVLFLLDKMSAVERCVGSTCSVTMLRNKKYNKRPWRLITQNSCRSVKWPMFSIFFIRLAAMSRVVSFFCEGKQMFEMLYVSAQLAKHTMDSLAFSPFRNRTWNFYNSHCFPGPQWPQCHCGSDRALSGWQGSVDPQF